MTSNTLEKTSLVPGIRLRQVRERLGLTYRDVEQASFEVAQRQGRAEFIVRISRLADFENSGVVPSLYKLFSLCSIYHLSPDEVCRWYDIPLADVFSNREGNGAPNTHLAAAPRSVYLPIRFDPGFDPQRTTYLTRMVQQWSCFEGAALRNGHAYHYGYIGSTDHWMEPLLRPGALVLVDPQRQRVDSGAWKSEAERPIYLIDIRRGYRCCWCALDGSRLVLHPHPLSPCIPESYQFPNEAEVVGRVIGVSMRLVDA